VRVTTDVGPTRASGCCLGNMLSATSAFAPHVDCNVSFRSTCCLQRHLSLHMLFATSAFAPTSLICIGTQFAPLSSGTQALIDSKTVLACVPLLATAIYILDL
jgi:hypothetical protein